MYEDRANNEENIKRKEAILTIEKQTKKTLMEFVLLNTAIKGGG